MEELFIEARRKFKDSDINLSALDELPGKTVSLAATIQYMGLVPKVKDYLETRGKKVAIKKGAYYDAHVLGCNSIAFNSESDTILLITDGKFHALNNALQLQRPIYVFTTKAIELLSKKDIDLHNKKTLAKQSKYLAADKVGLLFSTKDGQRSRAIEYVKKAIEDKGKQAYIFETNHIDLNSFENYPQIKIWINTACYGLARDDNRIINLADVLKFL